MALRKSQLYSSLWQSCDELRGGMDASQYKDYILTLLFVKYVSDKYAGKPDAIIEVPEGGSFADMAKLKGDKEIGDKINKIIGRLAAAADLDFLMPGQSADFNDEAKLGAGKEMQDRLSRLVAIFDGLDFRANRAEGDDLLGDAYEYLMRHFATESGKSKGQFYTPAEVSRILGWLEAAKPRGVIDDKEKKIKETPDLVVKKKKYKMDLSPPALIVARYFADEQAQVEILQAKHEDATRELEEFVEEHAVEEGLLEGVHVDPGSDCGRGATDHAAARGAGEGVGGALRQPGRGAGR